VVLALIALVAGKPEIKIKNICENPLIQIKDVTDSHDGAVDANSAITVSMDTGADTRGSDPFDMVATVLIKKWMLNGYVQLPQFLADMLGGKIEKHFGADNVKYMKRNQYRVKCPFKPLLGHCFPQKGVSKVTIKLKEFLGQLSKQANGWMKVELKAKAPRVPVTKAFCFALEMKLKV